LLITTNIKTESPGLVQPDVLGLPYGAQVVAVEVTHRGIAQPHLIVNFFPNRPPTDLADVARRLRAEFGSAVVVAFESDKQGFARVAIDDVPKPELRVCIAAAVAAVKRNWGWDESEIFTTEIAQTGESFSLPWSTDGRTWHLDEPV